MNKQYKSAPQAPVSNIVCHAIGDRCHGCAHYRGEADTCEYAQAPVSGFDAVGALESAISMLKLKPEDCLGCVQESCTEGWWIRDELIDNLCKVRNALASTQPPTAELLALPDKWRERNHKPEGGMISYRVNDCADELESILSRMQAPPQEGE